MLTASSRQVALFRRARDTLTIPALVLAVAAALVASAYVLWRPNVLKVAVAADNPVDQQMMRVASELLGAQHASVKLEVLPVANGQDAGSALVNGGADLAVLRSDSAANGQAQTVMMLRQDAAFFVAPKKGKVKRITDLGGRTIGIAGDSARGRRLMAAVLDFYQLPTDDLKLVPVPTGDIAQAFAQKRIDALLSIGAPTAKSVAEVVTEAARGAQELTFIKIEEAKAIAKRFPAIESVEIEQGAFGGRPTRPTESTTTVGYSVRLVAHAGLDTDVIADLVRELVAIRQNVNATVPGAGLMNVPDTDDNSSFVVHPGVKTYANGDRSTFMDRYSDWIYLGLFAASGIGSVFAGAIGWFKTQRRNEALAGIFKIEKLLDAIRDADSVEKLSQLEREADAIFRVALTKAASGALAGPQLDTFKLAMVDVRARIAAQRSLLASDARLAVKLQGAANLTEPGRLHRSAGR